MTVDNPQPIVYCGFCKASTKHPRKHLRKCHEDAYAYLRHKTLPWENYFTHAPLPDTAVALNKERLYKMAREMSILRQMEQRPLTYSNYKPPVVQEEPTTFSFIWPDILFKNREVHIHIQRVDRRFLPLEAPKSTELLNKIKEEFFTRHHGKKVYKLVAQDKKVLLNQSPDIIEILNLIEDAIELYNFRHERKTKTRFLAEKVLNSLSNEQILQIFQQHEDKSPYISYLYSLHHQSYKLIPILESISSSLEESFLFRTIIRGNTFVIWENINPARATYVFKISNQDERLQKILSYICEQEQAKRIYLKSKSNFQWASKYLGYVGCVEHEGMRSYMSNLENLLNSN